MTELMEKAWSLYEAEKAAGNAEAAETIGDAYTVLDMLDSGANMDGKEDYVYKIYLRISDLPRSRYGWKEVMQSPLYELRIAFEEALTEAGFLEADEEPEEDEEEELDYTNDKQHFDEWVADQRYDAYRDYDLAMGYEV